MIDQVTDPDNEPLHLAALLSIPCLSPGSHDYEPDIPGPLCCIIDAMVTKDPQTVKSVLQHILSAPGIPKLYKEIYDGLRNGNCAGTLYNPSWTPDPVATSQSLRLTVGRGLVDPAPGYNTLEVFCLLMADPIDSEAMASVGCSLYMEDYGHGSSRPIIAYVNRYLRDGGIKRRNRAAGLAWDLTGIIVAHLLDHSGKIACGALSAFPFKWAMMFRTWTVGCQGSRRVAEIERTGSDMAAVNEDLLWGYFAGITDLFDYERDWGRSADNIGIAFSDVNWVLECCTRIGKCPTSFFRHTFLPTIWWIFTTPQHVLTTDPAVIEVVNRHLTNSTNGEHGVTARSCARTIFEFIAKRAGVHDELVNDILSRLYTHKECLTDHDPAQPCPSLKTSTVLSGLIKSEDIWHEYDAASGSASQLPADGRKEDSLEKPFTNSVSMSLNLKTRLPPVGCVASSGFSLSCEKIALEVCTGQLETADSLVHRLEHRKSRVNYCDSIVNGHPFMLAMRPTSDQDRCIGPNSTPGNGSKHPPSIAIDAADPLNRAEVGNRSAKGRDSSNDIIPPAVPCGTEAHMKDVAPKLMRIDAQHICRPPLHGQQAVIFRYYNQAIPEHLLQLSQTDVFSSNFGNLAPCAPELAPTRVTGEPEKWRSRCWLMSENLVELINLLEHLPKSFGLEPLSALVQGFIGIMSPDHMHICSSKIQWSGIYAAVQLAMEVLDEDMIHTLVILLMANITDVPFMMMKNGECLCWMKELWWNSPLRTAKPGIYDKLAILTLPQPDLHEANRIALQLMGFEKGGVELPAWLC